MSDDEPRTAHPTPRPLPLLPRVLLACGWAGCGAAAAFAVALFWLTLAQADPQPPAKVAAGAAVAGLHLVALLMLVRAIDGVYGYLTRP